MKVCKKCKLSVNVNVVTCPECGEHDFKLEKLKICQLCGFVNKDANLYCDKCGKNFKEEPSEYAIATAVSLFEGAGAEGESRAEAGAESEAAQKAAENEAQTSRSMQERYMELKPEIEKGDYLNKYAYFIPTLSTKEKPMVVLPSFLDQADKNVEVYFVLPTPSDPDQLQMAKAEITAEQDIERESKRRYIKVWKKERQISYPSLAVFLLGFAMLFGFGFSFLGDVTGLQILAGYFVDNGTGNVVLAFIDQAVSYIYILSAGIIVLSLFFSAIFMISRKTKTKKILLIICQALVFLSAVGVYIMAPIYFDTDIAYFDEAGVLILLIVALVAFVLSFFYKYEKGAQRAKAEKAPKTKLPKESNAEQTPGPISVEADSDSDEIPSEADRFAEERRRREVGGNDFNHDSDFDLPKDF
ncbi:MAG: hypothetical protein FWG51_01110 [Firmicutes bacterium]|nr:hypothetical protein [Bacillota bacterium]